MELPRRDRGDELLPPGELSDIRKRLRNAARQHDLTTVIACAFDHRTRMLPFIYADLRMAPAGVRAIGSAMADAGFKKRASSCSSGTSVSALRACGSMEGSPTSSWFRAWPSTPPVARS